MKKGFKYFIFVFFVLLVLTGCGSKKDERAKKYNKVNEILVSDNSSSNVYINLFIDGFTLLKKDNKYAIVDKDGYMYSDYIYTSNFLLNGVPFTHFSLFDTVKKEYVTIVPKNGKLEYHYGLFTYRIRDGYAVAKSGKNDKFGVVDSNYNTIIDFKYDSVGDIKDGRFVAYDSYSTTKTGANIVYVFDEKGKLITKRNAYCYNDFSNNSNKLQYSQGMYSICVEPFKYAYMDVNGKIISQKYKDVASSFSEGLAAVQDNNYKIGYINTKGQLVIKNQFNVGNFSNIDFLYFENGYTVVQKNRIDCVINKKGQIVLNGKNKNATITKIVGTIYEYNLNKKNAYINVANGKKYAYDKMYSIGGDFPLVVVKNNKYYFIDKNFKVLFGGAFDDVKISKYDTYFEVVRNGKTGYLNIKTGDLVYLPSDLKGQVIHDTYLSVKKENKWGMYDLVNKKLIFDTIYDNMYFDSSDFKDNQMTYVEIGTKAGYVNTKGETVIGSFNEEIK